MSQPKLPTLGSLWHSRYNPDPANKPVWRLVGGRWVGTPWAVVRLEREDAPSVFDYVALAGLHEVYELYELAEPA